MEHLTRGFFSDRFGLVEGDLDRALGTALERRADHADLYFEFRRSESFSLEESLVKSATRRVSQGVGVRVLAGDRTGYAHSDEITVERLRIAAETARAIADDRAGGQSTPVGPMRSGHDLYPLREAPIDASLDEKLRLLETIDRIARRSDSRVKNVLASLSCEQKIIAIATSAGVRVEDVQPLVRLQVTCIAEEGGQRQRGTFGGGGRCEFGFLTELDGSDARPRFHRFTEEAVRQAILNLSATEAPAGVQTVVLGPGWPGILLHEAIGHGLEADFNRKGISAFSNRLGEMIASELCTVIDDGTIANRRGSLNVDDEGTPTKRTVLIERGRLTGYLQDRLNSALMAMPPTGNGRRESFAHIPMPRMTNTFMLAGEDDPLDIVRSVDRGLYAGSFSGGQVDITNGKFVFSASEAYRIEGGRLTTPIRGATLIGNGPDVLKRISRVGSDLSLDEGIGTCGKDGQSVPVGVGLPTIRIDGLTVGGTQLG